MADPLARVPVLRVHLEEIFDALDWMHSLLQSQAIAEAARDCMEQPRETRLTANVARAREHIIGYITGGVEDVRGA